MQYVGGITVDYSRQGEAPRSSATYTMTAPAVRGMEGVPFQQNLDRASANLPNAPGLNARYTVQKGDNLTQIVQERLKTLGKPASNANIYEGIRAVTQSNGLSNPNLIYPGQSLDLSTLGGAVLPPQASLAPAAFPVPMIEQIQTRELPPPLAKASSSLRHAPPRVPILPQPEPEIVPKEAPVVVAKAAPAPPLMPRDQQSGEGGPAEEVVSHAKHVARHTHDLSERLNAALTPRPEVTVRPASPWSRALGAPARLTSGYGIRKDPFTGRKAFHHGIDLAAPQGTKIYPFEKGTVTFNGWKSGYGRVVVVKHDNGVESIYGHTSKNHVAVGTRVDRDTVIAEVGSTGRSTGPHLHFEVRNQGKAVNPVPYLQHTRTAQR